MESRQWQAAGAAMSRMCSASGGLLRTGGTIALLSLALLLGACSPAADAPITPATMPASTAKAAAADPARTAARMQECRAKLEAGIPAGMVINASADNGRPILWVGPAWQRSPSKDKESLARYTACFFLSGDESKTLKFSIYEQSTDREIAVWDRSRLIEW